MSGGTYAIKGPHYALYMLREKHYCCACKSHEWLCTTLDQQVYIYSMRHKRDKHATHLDKCSSTLRASLFRPLTMCLGTRMLALLASSLNNRSTALQALFLQYFRVDLRLKKQHTPPTFQKSLGNPRKNPKMASLIISSILCLLHVWAWCINALTYIVIPAP